MIKLVEKVGWKVGD